MGMANGKNRGLLIGAAMALALGVILLAWGVSGLIGSRSTSPATRAAHAVAVPTAAFARPRAWPCPIPGNFKSIDIPVGLLCDYYEHGIEHAPPRDPSGVMQKRERFYAAPADPLETIPAHLGSGVDDRACLAKLEAWKSAWLHGDPAEPDALKALEPSCLASSLTSDVLIDAGRAIDWIGGDEGAASFFRVGLAKAEAEYARTSSGDPAGIPLLRALDQTKALWRIKDWIDLQSRFTLATALNVPLSPEERRAHYLVADMLYNRVPLRRGR